MEDFKINIFQSEKKISFPSFKELSAKECFAIREAVAKRIGLEQSDNGYEIVTQIKERAIPIREVNADSIEFDFKDLLKSLNLVIPPSVNLNWRHFDKIDKFSLDDLNQHFKYIWYPGPDDIDIFADDANWIIVVDAMGDVFFLDLSSKTHAI